MNEFKNETNSYLINLRNLKSDRNIHEMIRVSKSNNHKSNNKLTLKNRKMLNQKENFKNSFQQTTEYENPLINNFSNNPYKNDFYEIQKGLIIKTVRFHDFFRKKKNFNKEKIKTILKNHNENDINDNKKFFQYYIPIHSIYFKKKENQKNKNIKLNTFDNINSSKTDDSINTHDKIKIKNNKTFFPLINQNDNKKNKNKNKKNKTQIKFFDKKKLLNKNNILNIDYTNIKTRTIKIKKLNVINTYKKLFKINFLSQPGSNNGITKINQDCFFIIPEINNCQKIKIFGIFDGHGITGEKISAEIKDYFKNYFINLFNDNSININNDYNDDNNIKNNNLINIFNKKDFYKEYFTSKFKTRKIKFNIDSEDNNLHMNSINKKEAPDKIIQIYNKLSSNNYSSIYSSFKKLDENLHNKYSSSNFCHLSGSTALIFFLFNSQNCNKIISSNLGDSKIILISKQNKIKELNDIHTLYNLEEKNRIIQYGAEINSLNVGPLRLWFKNKKYPGLSITRSFGDFESDSLGVISIPDIKEYDLDKENIKILIFGTDGVWKFLSNEKIKDIILPYYEQNDIEGGTQKIKEIAYNLWYMKNPKGIADITVFVLFFK